MSLTTNQGNVNMIILCHFGKVPRPAGRLRDEGKVPAPALGCQFSHLIIFPAGGCCCCCWRPGRASHHFIAATLQRGGGHTQTHTLTRASNEPLRSLKLYNHGEGPYYSTRAFSLLKAATTVFTFKNLLRHYAKKALTLVDVKLGQADWLS